MKQASFSPTRIMVKVLCSSLVLGTLAGLAVGLLEVHDHGYWGQGLARLAVQSMSEAMNGAVRDVTLTALLLAAGLVLLGWLTRSWVAVAIYCMTISITFVLFVLGTNALLYHAAVQHASEVVQSAPHDMGPEQIARILEPLRGSFLGVYQVLLSSLSEHWGKLLLLCLGNFFLGIGFG